MPEENGAPEQAQKKGKGKKLILIIVALLLVVGGAGGFFFMKKKGSHGEAEAKKEEVIEEKVTLDLSPFIVNLLNSKRNKFLKVTLTLEMSDEVALNKAKASLPEIRDVIITLLTSKTADELIMPEGKLQLKDDIAMRLNQILGGHAVKKVYLTEFVMQ
ncbi:MAG: flagellar basal body protein FliL [Deltaproteobacteria bacterium]|nr:MAG: flagellar basal body protein FliL [Deltaproteobacteria bacterium]